MATGAEIQAALADARENDLSFDDIVVLLKRALLNAIVANSTTVELPWSSAGSRNTTITRAGATQMIKDLLPLCGGGVVSQLAEFREPR